MLKDSDYDGMDVISLFIRALARFSSSSSVIGIEMFSICVTIGFDTQNAQDGSGIVYKGFQE